MDNTYNADANALRDAVARLTYRPERKAIMLEIIERGSRSDSCNQCGGPHPFDTSVPSLQWNKVIRAAGLPEYLCLTCIVAEFAKANESFTATLWSGEAGPFTGLPIEVNIRSRVALDSALLSDANTELRVRIRELEDQLARY